jgi:hypothetical protein
MEDERDIKEYRRSEWHPTPGWLISLCVPTTVPGDDRDPVQRAGGSQRARKLIGRWTENNGTESGIRYITYTPVHVFNTGAISCEKGGNSEEPTLT